MEMCNELYGKSLLMNENLIGEITIHNQYLPLIPYITAYGEDKLLDFYQTDIDGFPDFAEKDFPNIKEHLALVSKCRGKNSNLSENDYDRLMELTYEAFFKSLELKNDEHTKEIINTYLPEFTNKYSNFYKELRTWAKDNGVNIDRKNYARLFFEKCESYNNNEYTFRNEVDYVLDTLALGKVTVPVYENKTSDGENVSFQIGEETMKTLFLASSKDPSRECRISFNANPPIEIWIEKYNGKIYYYIVVFDMGEDMTDIRKSTEIIDNPNMLKIPLEEFMNHYGSSEINSEEIWGHYGSFGINLEECAEDYYNLMNENANKK
jgi:hypothetical protein